MQTIVKICGMTDAASIQTAIDHKVDYLGFVFYEKSPRNLTPKQATKLTKNIPSHINKVAVLVNETNQFIEYIQKDFDYYLDGTMNNIAKKLGFMDIPTEPVLDYFKSKISPLQKYLIDKINQLADIKGKK